MDSIIEKIYEFDHNILLFIQEHVRYSPLTPVMDISSKLVNAGVLWILICLVLLCFKKTRLIGVMALSSLGLCFLVNNIIIKHAVARPRPFDTYNDLYPLIKKPKDYSFASGHTATSFAIVGILVRFIPKPIAVISVVYAFMVAFSRMYHGVHYPTDVLCGMAIGIIGSVVIYYIYSKKFNLDEYKIKKLSFAKNAE